MPLHRTTAQLVAILGIAAFCATASSAAEQPTFTFQLEPGFRIDDVSWNISDSDGDPNVLSEVSWNRLESPQVGLLAQVHDGKRTRIRGYVAYAEVTSGVNHDSDYLSNNRADEFSRTDNRADGDLYDIEISVGVSYKLPDPKLKGSMQATPLFGYAHYEQQLTMRDGNQVVSNPPSAMPLGPFDGLNSSYDTQWNAFWFGAELHWQYTPRWGFEFTYQRFVNGKFNASADWNLRADFQHPVSFIHTANGDGHSLRAGVTYVLNSRLFVTGRLVHNNFKAHTGTDTTFNADNTTSSTNLNAVFWRATAVSIGIGTRLPF